MAVSWLGTRSAQGQVFDPSALGQAGRVRTDDISPIPKGSLLIEAVCGPMLHPVHLLRYRALDPWTISLSVSLETDGTVRLVMRLAERRIETKLRTDLGRATQDAVLTFVWDAPGRIGTLTAYVPETGDLWQTRVRAPFPLSIADCHRIITAPDMCQMDSSVTFAALAVGRCPVGPMPGLCGLSAIDTPLGLTLLRDLKPGDLVCVDDGDALPVIWSGAVTLPALGHFAPMRLRRPYLGLWEDLTTSGDQRVCLSGSEVEYLFGEERVTTAVRHLTIRNCATPLLPQPGVVTYHQILLPRHAMISANGAAVEAFDASSLTSNPVPIRGSVLSALPHALWPNQQPLAAPILQGYEALTLTGVMIG
ncbi:MAG: Hint domain-containing protein [Pseudomonadota bacterium]